jgi:aldose 1-epimerase
LRDVLDSPFEQIALRRGLDLNWVINGRAGVLRRAARISDPDTGIVMEVSTTQPGVQLYTNNVTRATTGKGGRQYGNHSTPLHEVTIYRFSIDKD